MDIYIVQSEDTIYSIAEQYGLSGSGVWNIMDYFSQLWLMINYQFEIEKIYPEYES